MVEQRTENPRVAGSIPALGTIFLLRKDWLHHGRFATIVTPQSVKGFGSHRSPYLIIPGKFSKTHSPNPTSCLYQIIGLVAMRTPFPLHRSPPFFI
jgi:Flp pilus assembly secretin CpaC